MKMLDLELTNKGLIDYHPAAHPKQRHEKTLSIHSSTVHEALIAPNRRVRKMNENVTGQIGEF